MSIRSLVIKAKKQKKDQNVSKTLKNGARLYSLAQLPVFKFMDYEHKTPAHAPKLAYHIDQNRQDSDTKLSPRLHAVIFNYWNLHPVDNLR